MMQKKKLEPKNLLIIEDDESMRSAYQRVFSSEGYLLKMAADATELTKVLDDQVVDLIILDQNAFSNYGSSLFSCSNSSRCFGLILNKSTKGHS